MAEVIEDAFVPFEESDATRRARQSSATSRTDESTFNYTVSEADGDHVPQQIEDAERFMRSHLDDLIDLLSYDGVESSILDFGWELTKDARFPWNRFPSSLLTLCGKVGLDIDVSIYRVSRRKWWRTG